eukprot:7265981-Pyramimonas_sp.AAC.1
MGEYGESGYLRLFLCVSQFPFSSEGRKKLGARMSAKVSSTVRNRPFANFKALPCPRPLV